MNDEYKEALKDLEIARTNYNNADENFKDSAYFALRAAEEKVMAIIRERKVK